uniref:Uncharacterized protein n=1 Tax=Cucumis melo TaxID=3656 RepID=A0A9I9EEU0_CUCME
VRVFNFTPRVKKFTLPLPSLLTTPSPRPLILPVVVSNRRFRDSASPISHRRQSSIVTPSQASPASPSYKECLGLSLHCWKSEG